MQVSPPPITGLRLACIEWDDTLTNLTPGTQQLPEDLGQISPLFPVDVRRSGPMLVSIGLHTALYSTDCHDCHAQGQCCRYIPTSRKPCTATQAHLWQLSLEWLGDISSRHSSCDEKQEAFLRVCGCGFGLQGLGFGCGAVGLNQYA